MEAFVFISGACGIACVWYGYTLGRASVDEAVRAAVEAERSAQSCGCVEERHRVEQRWRDTHEINKQMLAAGGLDMRDFDKAMERLRDEGLTPVTWIANVKADRDEAYAANSRLFHKNTELTNRACLLEHRVELALTPSRN